MTMMVMTNNYTGLRIRGIQVGQIGSLSSLKTHSLILTVMWFRREL